jgi:hypothetical protein
MWLFFLNASDANLIFSLLDSDILSHALFNFRFRYFSPTLIEEEEEWIDAKDFKHILDLRHKIRPFLLKKSIKFFPVNAFPSKRCPCPRCLLSMTKIRSLPFLDGAFPIKGASFQFLRWGSLLSMMEPVPVQVTFPCQKCCLSFSKMVPFPAIDKSFPVKDKPFPVKNAFFPFQLLGLLLTLSQSKTSLAFSKMRPFPVKQF